MPSPAASAYSPLDPIRQLLQMEADFGLVVSRFLLCAGVGRLGNQLNEEYEKGTVGHCYQNAFELAIEHPRDLVYCEGRALGLGLFPVPHAWCVQHDGQVVDNTWPQPAQAAYFGVGFDTKWLIEWTSRQKFYGVFSEIFPQELLMLDPSVYLAAETDPEVVEKVRALRQCVR